MGALQTSRAKAAAMGVMVVATATRLG